MEQGDLAVQRAETKDAKVAVVVWRFRWDFLTDSDFADRMSPLALHPAPHPGCRHFSISSPSVFCFPLAVFEKVHVGTEMNGENAVYVQYSILCTHSPTCHLL